MNKSDSKIPDAYWTIETKQGFKAACEPTLGSFTTQALLDKGTWFEPEIDIVHKFIGQGGIFIDIGANIGLYTNAVASKDSSCTILAIEPNPRASFYLKKSIEINKYSNVSVAECAISNNEGVFNFYAEGNTEYGSLHGRGSASFTVKTQTFNQILSPIQPEKIDLIKIDAEGAEVEIVNSALEFFSKLDPVVIFEYFEISQKSPVAKLFESIGYKLYYFCPTRNAIVPMEYDDASLINVIALKESRIVKLGGDGRFADNIRRPSKPSQVRAKYKKYLKTAPFPAGVGLQLNELDPAYKRSAKLCESLLSAQEPGLHIATGDIAKDKEREIGKLVSLYGRRMEFAIISLYMNLIAKRYDVINEEIEYISRKIDQSKISVPIIVKEQTYCVIKGESFREWIKNYLKISLYEMMPSSINFFDQHRKFYDEYSRRYQDPKLEKASLLRNVIVNHKRRDSLDKLALSDIDRGILKSIVEEYGTEAT